MANFRRREGYIFPCCTDGRKVSPSSGGMSKNQDLCDTNGRVEHAFVVISEDSHKE